MKKAAFAAAIESESRLPLHRGGEKCSTTPRCELYTGEAGSALQHRGAELTQGRRHRAERGSAFFIKKSVFLHKIHLIILKC